MNADHREGQWQRTSRVGWGLGDPGFKQFGRSIRGDPVDGLYEWRHARLISKVFPAVSVAADLLLHNNKVRPL